MQYVTLEYFSHSSGVPRGFAWQKVLGRIPWWPQTSSWSARRSPTSRRIRSTAKRAASLGTENRNTLAGQTLHRDAGYWPAPLQLPLRRHLRGLRRLRAVISLKRRSPATPPVHSARRVVCSTAGPRPVRPEPRPAPVFKPSRSICSRPAPIGLLVRCRPLSGSTRPPTFPFQRRTSMPPANGPERPWPNRQRRWEQRRKPLWSRSPSLSVASLPTLHPVSRNRIPHFFYRAFLFIHVSFTYCHSSFMFVLFQVFHHFPPLSTIPHHFWPFPTTSHHFPRLPTIFHHFPPFFYDFVSFVSFFLIFSYLLMFLNWLVCIRVRIIRSCSMSCLFLRKFIKINSWD